MRAFLIILGIAVLGVAAFFIIKSRNSVDFNSLGAPPATNRDCGSLANFFGGHEGRKNAIAPSIIKNYAGVSDAQAKQIAAIASKLSPSAYAEKFVGEKLAGWLCGKSVTDIIKGAAGAVVEGVKDAAVTTASTIGSGAKEAATTLASGAKTTASTLATGLKSVAFQTQKTFTSVPNLINPLNAGNVATSAVNIAQTAANTGTKALTSGASTLVNTASKIGSTPTNLVAKIPVVGGTTAKVLNATTSVPTKIGGLTVDAAKTVFQGGTNLISSGVKTVTGTVSSAGSAIKSGLSKINPF